MDGMDVIAVAEDGSPAMAEDESVLLTLANTAMHVGSRPEAVGRGTLFVTSQRVVWLTGCYLAPGISVHFKHLLLHAVCRDTSTFPHACVYCQLEDGFAVGLAAAAAAATAAAAAAAATGTGGPAEEDSEGSEHAGDNEVRFVPHAPVAMAGMAVAASAAAGGGGGGDDPLDALFSALSRGAELNPDDSDDGEEGGGGGGGFGGGGGAGFASGGFYGDLGGGVMGVGEAGDFVFDSAEVTAGAEQAALATNAAEQAERERVLARLDALLTVDDGVPEPQVAEEGQFADA
jgi:hypothetical protein